MKGRPAGPRELARQLLTSGGADGDRSSTSRGRAVREAVLALSRWIGPNALDPLLSRAVVVTLPHHAVATDLPRILRTENWSVELKQLTSEHGEERVNAALEALLIALLELLSRLIGDEMSARILDSAPGSMQRREAKESQ